MSYINSEISEVCYEINQTCSGLSRNTKNKILVSTLKKSLNIINTLNNKISFYQNNYDRHIKMIEDMKEEIKKLKGVNSDRQVPDIDYDLDYRPRAPSPVEEEE